MKSLSQLCGVRHICFADTVDPTVGAGICACGRLCAAQGRLGRGRARFRAFLTSTGAWVGPVGFGACMDKDQTNALGDITRAITAHTADRSGAHKLIYIRLERLGAVMAALILAAVSFLGTLASLVTGSIDSISMVRDMEGASKTNAAKYVIQLPLNLPRENTGT
jgi:hypothetical protein